MSGDSVADVRYRYAPAGTLQPGRIRELRALVEEFLRDYDAVAADEITRFQIACDWMFGRLTNRDEHRALGPSQDWAPTLPAGGNLDTGDSSADPFEPFRAALSDEVRHSPDLARYVGAEPVAELVDAARRFLRDNGFPFAAAAGKFDLLVGSGTVNLFDAVCRHILVQPGDTILVPDVGYGFFLAQPYRAGGAVATVCVGPDGKLDAAAIDAAVARVDAALFAEWLPDSEARLWQGLVECSRRGLLGSPPTRADATWLAGDLHTLDADGARHLLAARVGRRWPELLATGPRHRAPLDVLRPPRCRALLHINPGVTGAVYDRQALHDIADAVERRDLVVVEDIAYHSIRLRPADCHSLMEHTARVVCLFGISKPFALAGVRIGVMWVPRADSEPLKRLIENSVGFVWTGLQRALAAALDTPADVVAAYLDAESDGPTGYGFRRALMFAMVLGVDSPRVPDRYRDSVRETLVAELDAYFRWKHRHGNVLATDPGLDALPAPGRYADLPREVRDGHAARAAEFMALGLRDYFDVEFDAEAGFFLILDCRPMLRRGRVGDFPVRRPFEVFALLALLFGVRTIPEEMIAVPGPTHGRLRVAFAPAVTVLVRAMFTVHLGLTHLDRARGAVSAP